MPDHKRWYFKQVVGSALLLICANAIIDQKNCNVPLSLVAFYMGCIIIGLGLSFNLNCGVPVNPARDLSPRLFTYLVGWGPQVFRYFNYYKIRNFSKRKNAPFLFQSYNNWMWFWIPLVIPHAGAVLGAYIYIIFIEAHWPK